MDVLNRLRSFLRPFFFGCILGVFLVSAGMYAERLGFLDGFIDYVYAATGTIRPNGNGSVNNATQASCAGTNWSCLDDVVTDPTVPVTTSDYLTHADGNVDFFQMGDNLTDVATATKVTVHIYHIEASNNMQLDVSLWNAAETVQYGTTTVIANTLSSKWDSVPIGGLALTQSDITGLRVRVGCNRTSGGKANTCTSYAMYADVDYSQVIDLAVSATGSQVNLDAGQTNGYVGATFVVSENFDASHDVTSITINETGSIDAANDISNVKLYYENAADCSVQSYNGTESQYGTTQSAFSGANGSVTFTDSGIGVSTTLDLCLYVVLDVADTATENETIELQITNPSSDVVGSGGAVVEPATPVALSGTTFVQKVNLTQIHYHWRNDDGTEVSGAGGATSATGATEDTPYASFPRNDTKRIRLGVSNEGNKAVATSTNILNAFSTGNTKTISSGANRLLLVGIHSEDSGSNVDVNTVTYGGQTLTEVADQQVTTSFSNGMWVGYLDEEGIRAASGSTIVPSWNGGTPDETILYSSVVFENVDQSNPVPGWSGNTVTGVATVQPTTTVSVIAGDTSLYFTVNSGLSAHTPSSGYTEGTEQTTTSGAANAYKAITGSGTEQPTADWTSAQSRLAIVALTVRFAHQYRIEYATKVTNCSDIADANWTDVGATADAWDMAASQLVEGNNTTNVALPAYGAVTDGSGSFLSTNGGQRESTSQTGNITLTNSQFVELEYALQATASAVDGTTYCFRVTNQDTPLDTYSAYPEASINADLTVTASGTQAATANIPNPNFYNGGQFTITDTSAANTHVISSVTIHASGTVDLQNDISNIRLYYDLDQTAPYDCTGESFGGDELQYGATSTGGFSAAATSTFTDTVTASTTQGVCLYPVYDVDPEASNGETIEIRMEDPSVDIVASGGTISPSSLIDFIGVTTFAAPYINQVHYHWRDNLGTEATAGSLTGGEDVAYTNFANTTVTRLRFGIANTGGATSGNYQYQLEWAQKVSTCDAIASWTDIDAGGDDWSVVASQLSDNSDTTDIGTTTGGVTNVGSFLGTNGGQQDVDGQTGNIDLPAGSFLELEYSIQAEVTVPEGASFCFRVTNNGVPINTYTRYPEATIKLATDFTVYRGVSVITGTSSTLFEGLGLDYDLKFNSSTRAFIRITNAHHTGGGPAAGSTGNHNSDDVTAYIVNPGNITNNVTIARTTASPVSDTRVAWEVVEYTGPIGGENEMIVRSASAISYGAGNLTATTSAVSGISNDARVLPFITGQYNNDTGRLNYNYGLSTSFWNAGADTVTFTRGESGSDSSISYAVLEFTGSNWRVQRVENAFVGKGTPETQPITLETGDITRAFVHAQKRAGSGQDNHSDFGHEVWISSMTNVSFRLNTGAGTPSLHTSVAWVVENVQNTGTKMFVQQDTGTIPAGGGGLTIQNDTLATEIIDLSTASLFVNGSSDGTGRTFPEPMVSASIISTTQFQLQVSDDADNVTYRAETVEWPTASRKLFQNYYRLYEDNDLQTPTTSWAGLGENTEMTASDSPIANGESIRVRMTLNVTAASMPSGVDAFRLQYGERTTTCTAITDWKPLGDIGSSTALWRGHAGTPADGSTLASTTISVSDVFGTYEEENNTALTPNLAVVGDDIEFDWSIEDNGAPDKTDYCFRMVEANSAELTGYNNYPVIRTVGYEPEIGNWKWFNDETSLTPTDAIAGTSTAPSDIAFADSIKLRTIVSEKSGGTGTDIKFKLQYSEYPDFSQKVYDVVATSTCTASSTWCYADGAGVDNAVIDDNTLGPNVVCSGGVGSGCGTHNEGTATTTATFDHAALTDTEFEFTIQHAGARANAVYYFRLWNVNINEPVVASSSYPSLMAEGPSLVFTVSGLPSQTATENIVTDATSTPTGVSFGSVPVNTEYEIAHRLQVNTNATEGYQMLVYTDQKLTSNFGAEIEPVTGTNASPSGWLTGCVSEAQSCFGYHTGDDLLEGGSARFGAFDSYAGFAIGIPEEIMYSSVPVNESHDIVYKIQIGDQHPPGDYEANISYIAIPVF